MGMRDAEVHAAWIVCLGCEEKKCVGRHNCKWLDDYLKTKLVEIDHVKSETGGDGNG